MSTWRRVRVATGPVGAHFHTGSGAPGEIGVINVACRKLATRDGDTGPLGSKDVIRSRREYGRLCHNTIRGVWISNARDDCIENDGLECLTVDNSLLDGCFAGISSDPGGCKECPPSHQSKDEIRLSGVLMRLQGFPYTYEGNHQMHHVGAFKIHGKYGPRLVIENSIIALEFYDPDRYAFWKAGWKKIKSCSNNYLLWLSDEPFPLDARFPRSPRCFKVLTGLAARQYWEKARAQRISNHPDIMRVDGDPPAGP